MCESLKAKGLYNSFLFSNLGGVEITLDAEKMGELIKLDPKLVLEDCKSEIAHNDSLEDSEDVM